MTGIPGAMVNAFAVSTNEPDVMYAGTWGSGVYRSADGGSNWEHYQPGSVGLVQSLAVDPRDSETVLALFASSGLYPNQGLLRTTDGGRTWLPVTAEGRFERFYEMAMHRYHPDTLYVHGRDSSDFGVYISTDNGLAWTKISGLWGFDELAFVSDDPDSVLAIDYDDFYVSSDGGFNFSRIDFQEYYGILADIEIDPQHPGVVYIAAEEGLLRTTDSCQTWDIIQTPFGYDPADTLSNPPELEHIVLSTHDTFHLLAADGEANLYASSDGGDTWSLREPPPQFPYISSIYEIHFWPTDTSYLIGTWWQGMLRLTPQGWTTANEGLDNQITSGIEIVDKNTLYMSTLGNGFFATADGGQTWEQRVSGLDSWHISEIVSYPSYPEILLAATYDHGFFRTVDGGSAWIKVAGEAGEDGRAVCISPSNPDSIFAIGYNNNADYYTLYRSADGGQNWDRIFAQDTSLYALAIDPMNANHVLLSTRSWSSEAGFEYYLVESSDGGDTWDWAGADTLNGSVRDFVFLPGDNELLITIMGAGVLARDEGGTWIRRDTTGLPEAAGLLFMSLGPNQELVAGVWGGGVYRSWDRGYTWLADALGMAASGPLNYSWKVAGADTVEIVGTYNGPYSYGYDVLGLPPDRSLRPMRAMLHSNYPNPFNPTTSIRYDLATAGEISLTVYDILGREVAELVSGYWKAGYHQVIWDGRDLTGRELPSGLYIARLEAQGFSTSIKMLLLK